ncbi:MAG: ABC transporter substrate-binding protein [bacterium]|nr:ABC transporter substrate-binding protein [bacterium]
MESHTPKEAHGAGVPAETFSAQEGGNPGSLFARLFTHYTAPYESRIAGIVRELSPFETFIWWVLIAAFLAGTVYLLSGVHAQTTVEVPARGGTLREGVIGAPRFINPLLAISDTDRDLSMLIYTGLMRPGKDGALVPDLAERYSVSEDGTEYRFVLRDDAHFHDGTPLTADDVVFTVRAAQDSALKSPRRSDWDGVVVEKVNDREVLFTLQKPYAPFLENTTLGILPRHLWQGVTPEEFSFSNLNSRPIGAGPYRLGDISFDKTGVPLYYELRSFRRYTLGEPYIKNAFIYFFANEERLMRNYDAGTISSLAAVSPAALSSETANRSRLLRMSFPRIFAVFFNQNRNHVFTSRAVRDALNAALDKERIVEEVLGGYGTVIDSPIPPETIARSEPLQREERGREERIADVRAILEAAGWEFNADENQWEDDGEVLAFSLATANTAELKAAAEAAAKMWEEAGIPARVNIFETGDLNQNIIRPRNYEALLFGEVVGRSLDLFAFWHSSQKNDPGLNIALYTNLTGDKLLEQARTVSDKEERDELYLQFEEELHTDIPAVFLYAPDFIYIVPETLKGVGLDLVTTPSERFADIHLWHIDTQRVWHFFAE